MSEIKAFIDADLMRADLMRAGLSIVFVQDTPDGRLLSNGSTNWYVRRDNPATVDVEPLRLSDDQGRALLAGLLRHYDGADDARMLRKDYDDERKRVDLLIGKLSAAIVVASPALTTELQR